MFRKVLVANRGEIACRILETCRRLGVPTVSVYSDVDANARHVRLADEAVHIGAAPARDSYLREGAILEAAKATGATAIHPGYGFLSENADFAEACHASGVVFVGPPASAIRAMGSKSAAKTLMEEAGVSLVPGYHGEDASVQMLARKAGEIGYPVLLKASAGGGGKGMRIVRSPDDFEKEFASCQREAKASFGEDQMLVERYLEGPRHIEIQVFADAHGHCVHLFERDCSVQRRHQKVLEEAPAPGMDLVRREAMGSAAIDAAKAVAYVGAGTVEFIVDSEGAFYFMEMNTRLQVEHPVTEMITGLDLVEWQLRVAAGEALPLEQNEIALRGHAVEARIYAEDPARNFLPSVGTLVHFGIPASSEFIRVDSGVECGDAITPYYDPMIAKLIAWGEDRGTALRRLCAALAQTRIVGVRSNVEFLGRVASNPAFVAGDFDTGFIERESDKVLPPAGDLPASAAAAVVVFELLRERESSGADELDPHSPWSRAGSWRLNGSATRRFELKFAKQEYSLRARIESDSLALEMNGVTHEVAAAALEGGELRFELDGTAVAAWLAIDREQHHVFVGPRSFLVSLVDPLALTASGSDAHAGLASPMPGRVISLLVEPGKVVPKGTPLLVLEAMKMEHTITAPARGAVKRFRFSEGDQVPEGAPLLEFEAAS